MLLSLAQPLLLRLPSRTTPRPRAAPRSLATATTLGFASPARGVAARLRAVVSEREVGMEAAAEAEGRPLRVGLVCGGPSAERGISLNSARSVLDHIQVSLRFALELVWVWL